jgi:hypothetical protein
LAARLQILCIALEAGLAEALARHTHCIGAARDSLAEVLAALRHIRLLREALFKGVATHVDLTPAVVAAHRVDADGVFAAQTTGALVHVRASKEGDTGKAGQTLADLTSISVGATLGVVATIAVILAIVVFLFRGWRRN